MEVVRKDGLILIREMAAEVKNMMDIKMNAVLVSKIFSIFPPRTIDAHSDPLNQKNKLINLREAGF